MANDKCPAVWFQSRFSLNAEQFRILISLLEKQEEKENRNKIKLCDLKVFPAEVVQ